MTHTILLRDSTEIRWAADSWWDSVEVSQTGQNLQTDLWEKRFPISKFFSFWRIVPISLIRLIFHYSCFEYFSWTLYIMAKGCFPMMSIVSNQIFHLKDHFYLFSARWHYWSVLTKRKNPSFHFKTLQWALRHLENRSAISGGLGPGSAFLQSISSVCPRVKQL